MSSFAQQPRARQARARSRSPASSSARSSSPTPSVDTSAILLFAPPRAQASLSQSWDVLPSQSQSHARALSPASTSASSGTQASSSGVGTLSRSLFPSHDGNGIFAADSLLLSEQSDASYASPSEHSTSASSTRSDPRTARIARPRTRTRSPPAPAHLGGSWALTEEALSALPDADTPVALARHRHRPASAADTSSDSSAREDDDEDLLSSTPHAASAGLGSARWRRVAARALDERSQSSAGPYPSPLPVSLARRTKRRHRQEGRGAGSQKRSSTSGSARAPPPAAAPLAAPRTPVVAARKEPEAAFFGKLVRKLANVDDDTFDQLHAAASLPTPTPSRSTSPVPLVPHGFQALASHARSELGFGFSYDVDMRALSDDSGDETETDGARWVHQDLRAPRSHSLTSLPSYFLAPLSPATAAATIAKDAPPLLRRTSSFSGAPAAATDEEGNAWGGDFEGFEAALSYWRRIFRRMRGV